jgi:hypothetical protein
MSAHSHEAAEGGQGLSPEETLTSFLSHSCSVETEFHIGILVEFSRAAVCYRYILLG